MRYSFDCVLFLCIGDSSLDKYSLSVILIDITGDGALNKIDSKMFEMCRQVASLSTDTSHKIGCIIRPYNTDIIIQAWNRLPCCVFDDGKKMLHPLKDFYVEHAERIAIYNAAKRGSALLNASMWITGLPPCHECARAIIESGIARVSAMFKWGYVTPKWHESFSHAKKMFNEACVIYKEYKYV